MANHWVFNQGATTVLQFPEVNAPLVDPALYDAARTGCVSACEIMIARGAEPNLMLHGLTPLHVAAQAGQGAVCGLLVDRGANVNALSKDGCTALFLAASAGHSDVCKVLVAGGADKSMACNGKTPLQAAEGGGHSHLKALLA
mmetsp:Transcript_49644/g.118192  ORF Transcript_49644/g.118192 Transcript_49644/m.118192 type:complete len:143 (+) Transcript_49644:83-511(+)